MIKVLFLGEIVGLTSVKEISIKIEDIIDKYKIDIIIANADGASDGYGLLRKTAFSLFEKGINVITSGDFVFNKKDSKDLLNYDFFLRPYNLPNAYGGRGYTIIKNNKFKIGIINISRKSKF